MFVALAGLPAASGRTAAHRGVAGSFGFTWRVEGDGRVAVEIRAHNRQALPSYKRGDRSRTSGSRAWTSDNRSRNRGSRDARIDNRESTREERSSKSEDRFSASEERSSK